jgi:predicted Zn-dependent protease
MMRSILCFVLAATFAAGCYVNPVTNRPQVILTSRDTEKTLGDEEAKKVEATLGIVADPELNAYVAAIGERLAGQAPADGYDFRFQVVDMKEPNAFALPGGHVYVSRGILMLANSEDELAGVIGHEIAHVLGRDSGSRISLGAPLTLATGIGAAATGIVSPVLGHLVGGIGGLTQGLLLSPYDRQQERNADQYGLQLAAAAGWQPQALPEILHSLERYEGLQGESSRALSFFASHPRTPERVRNTAREATAVERSKAAPIAADRAAFLNELDGLVVGDDPSTGFFEGPLFIQPEMQLAVRFPEGWETQNSPHRVVAVAPGGEALAILTHAGEGDDPKAVADAIAAQGGIDSGRFKTVDVNGLRAVRSGVITGRNGGRPTSLEATWIAHRGNVYQIVCATTPDRLETFHTAFVQTPHSFRPTTRNDLVRVRVERLRIHRARAGETMAGLLKRVGSSWDVDTATVANAVESGTVLADGALVKAAVAETYRP